MTISKETIEIITESRRRRFSGVEKLRIVEETYQPGMSVSYVARLHKIQPSLLFKWRKLYETGALTAMSSEDKVVPLSQVKELEKRVKQLERILGKKTVENEILKEAVKIGREKKLISRQPLPGIEGSD